MFGKKNDALRDVDPSAADVRDAIIAIAHGDDKKVAQLRPAVRAAAERAARNTGKRS